MDGPGKLAIGIGLVASAALVSACGSGGRLDASSRSADEPAVPAASGQLELLVDPLGQALQPTGLGYRVVTTLGDEAPRESFGIDLLPLLIDVDGDVTTGLAGADIVVQLGALSVAYALEVRRLPNAPAALPLRVEAEFTDPLQLVTGRSDELVRMGYDARDANAPDQFREAVLIADLPAIVLGVQSATLEIAVTGASDSLIALGGLQSVADERDRLDIAVRMQPPPATTRVEALFGGALSGGDYRLSTSEASRLDIVVDAQHPDAGQDHQQLTLDRIAGAISLYLQDEDGTRLSFSADQRSDYLEYRAQRQGRSIEASLAPLPRALDACLSSSDACGSHGGSTRSSLTLSADEPVLLNYRAERGKELTLVEDMIVSALAVDFGSSSSFRKGYVFFDTDDEMFSGRVRQVDSKRGFDLRFGHGTHAQDRKVTWKNFVQTDKRNGSMRCPGGADLDLKVDGRFYDADFVVDTLCQ